MNYEENFYSLIQSVFQALEKQIDRSTVRVIDRGRPHIPKDLPPKTMAVYTFLYRGKFLKIGKAGPSSSARFLSQHYSPSSSQSNLAASILKDPDMFHLNLNENTVGPWIKENCRRIDILLDQQLGIFALEVVEAILHYKYQPKYEGIPSQR